MSAAETAAAGEMSATIASESKMIFIVSNYRFGRFWQGGFVCFRAARRGMVGPFMPGEDRGPGGVEPKRPLDRLLRDD